MVSVRARGVLFVPVHWCHTQDYLGHEAAEIDPKILFDVHRSGEKLKPLTFNIFAERERLSSSFVCTQGRLTFRTSRMTRESM